MAKPNYKFQKRQKELAKQKKKEEKRKRKEAKKLGLVDETTDEFGEEVEPSEETAPPSED